MSIPKLAVLIAFAGLLGACSRSPAPDSTDLPKRQAPAQASTAIPASNPFATMLKTRDRAKSVQQTLKAHDDAERKALKDAQQ